MDQTAAIPFRHHPSRGLELLLVTSSSGDKWVFPKGSIEGGATGERQAAVECYEEAGVVGVVMGPPFGSFRYLKNERPRMVEVFLLEVLEVLRDYPERHRRLRRWCTAEEALRLHGRTEADEVLRHAVDLLTGTRQPLPDQRAFAFAVEE